MRAFRFTDLRVYRAALELCDEVYSVYGLKSQLRRASVSIGSNIAKGSAEEIRHLLLVCSRRGFIKLDPRVERQIDTVCSMLFNLRQAVLQKGKEWR